MSQSIVQVDAFTNEPFGGNPAAVCVMPGPADEGWMQNVAREMNLSETAFLYSEGDDYQLRWFTPAVEVDLCGHATLSSAHVLFEEHGYPKDKPIRFHTKSGLLSAQKQGAWIELDFPTTPVIDTTAPPKLLEALGVKATHTGKSRTAYLVELESEEAVRAIEPDFGLLARVDLGSIIITGRATTSEFDFVSRFFGPGLGIDEDPVTGFAHTLLAPYWAERLGKSEFVAYQASKRGGVLRLRLKGERVRIAGQAVTVLRGELV